MNEAIFTESGFLTSRDKSGVMVSLSNHARKDPSPCINAMHGVQATLQWFDKLTMTLFDKLTMTPTLRFNELKLVTSTSKTGVMESLSNHVCKGLTPCISAMHGVQATPLWFDKLTMTPPVRFNKLKLVTSTDKSGAMVSLSNHTRKGLTPCISAMHGVQATPQWFDKLTMTLFDKLTMTLFDKLTNTPLIHNAIYSSKK